VSVTCRVSGLCTVCVMWGWAGVLHIELLHSWCEAAEKKVFCTGVVATDVPLTEMCVPSASP
jgi:hypothetical protein